MYLANTNACEYEIIDRSGENSILNIIMKDLYCKARADFSVNMLHYTQMWDCLCYICEISKSVNIIK